MDTVHDGRKPHWFWMDNQVIDTHGETIGAVGLAVYAILARHADKQGQAHPGLSRFHKLAGLTKPTVRKYLKLLQKTGLITIGTRLSPDGDADSNLYTLLPILVPEGGKVVLPPSQRDLLPSKTALPGGVVKDVYQGGKAVLPEGNSLKEEKKNPFGRGSAQTYSDAFLTFWAEYPRKVKKAKAWGSVGQGQL